jgi:hypothetical protein
VSPCRAVICLHGRNARRPRSGGRYVGGEDALERAVKTGKVQTVIEDAGE